METQQIEVRQAEVLQAISRSEIDVQISTAKQYPRNVSEALNKIVTYATMDEETAAECFYVLRRGGQNGGGAAIEGLSVRMAEIMAGAWGNLRVQTRIVGNDGRTVTAQGVCHDLETNMAVSVEVKRRITDKWGKTYSEDMQVMTGNAASAIAYRNAVLKVIPKAITKRAIEEVRRVAVGQALDLETSRQNMIAYFGKLGVGEEVLLGYLGKSRREEIDREDIFQLRATANAIKEGTTNVRDCFLKPAEEKDLAAAAKAKAEEVKARAIASQGRRRRTAKTIKPEAVKPETVTPATVVKPEEKADIPASVFDGDTADPEEREEAVPAAGN